VNFPVFRWEQFISDLAKGCPQQGLLYDFMFFWSHPGKTVWLLIACLVIALIVIRGRHLLLPIILSSIAVGLSDLYSRRIVKAFVMRPRPRFVGQECLQSYCWGFVSSHSTNIAAFATVMCLYDRRNLYWCVPLTLLVFTSRIYLLDHFPLDVLGGGISGVAIGSLVWSIGVGINSWFESRPPRQFSI